jgi:hypothetical protein
MRIGNDGAGKRQERSKSKRGLDELHISAVVWNRRVNEIVLSETGALYAKIGSTEKGS